MCLPCISAGDGNDPEHEMNGSPDGQSDEPEPKEDEDLLVDDIHGQDAQTVFVLHCARRTVFVERAFGYLSISIRVNKSIFGLI